MESPTISHSKQGKPKRKLTLAHPCLLLLPRPQIGLLSAPIPSGPHNRSTPSSQFGSHPSESLTTMRSSHREVSESNSTRILTTHSMQSKQRIHCSLPHHI